jgi:VacB/RNase II family 3'-5' exoribonuclease
MIPFWSLCQAWYFDFKKPWEIPQSEIDNRVDLRSEIIFTIDPLTARDLDDALSCKDLGNGTFEVGVHIADVSFFVPHNSKLDHAAKERATSVYMVQKVIPMLPRTLCEELCSLNPHVDRLAFSVFWILDSNGDVIGEPRFTKSVIRSCIKLAYEHAQKVIDGQSLESIPELCGHNLSNEIQTAILHLYKLSIALRTKRVQGGSLSLDSPKLWFILDENDNPVECGPYQRKESHKLIEEFMLLANIAVAGKILAHYPEFALLRCHQPPDSKNLAELELVFKALGLEVNVNSSKSLNESFENIKDESHKFIAKCLAVRKMKPANYFGAGATERDHYRHYALAIPLYTHFT